MFYRSSLAAFLAAASLTCGVAYQLQKPPKQKKPLPIPIEKPKDAPPQGADQTPPQRRPPVDQGQAQVKQGAAKKIPGGEPQSVSLWAASRSDRHQVELRWIPEQGWLPAGGYNLYRISGGTATKVNPAFIYPENRTIAADPALFAMMAKASLPLSPAGQAKAKAALDAANASTVSSTTEFREARNEAVAAAATKAPSVAGRMRVGISQNPKIKEMASKRVATAVVKSQAKNQRAAMVNPDDDINAARDSLRFSTLMDADSAHTLGMTFTDETAMAGQTYTYELRAVTDGDENPVGQVKVTVGGDLPMAKPLVEAPIQLSQTEVGLHFSGSTVHDSIENGLTKFNIYRIVDGVKTKLNGDRPILLSYAAMTDGKLKEQILTFDDAAAPARKTINYDVEAIDMFGRTGDTVVPIVMADLAEPLEQPVPVCVGPVAHPVPGSSAVTVFWTPTVHTTDDTPQSIMVEGKGNGRQNWETIDYNLERINTDSPSNPPTILATNVAGTTEAGFKDLTVGDMFKLYPWLAKELAPYMHSSTVPDGFTADTPALDLVEHRQFPAMFHYNYRILTFVDQHPPADHYYEYRLTPVLMRNGRPGVPQTSSRVAVPATVLPTAPTGLNQTNTFAPTDPGGFQSLKNSGSMTNATKHQLTAGHMSPAGEELSNTAAVSTASSVSGHPTIAGVRSNYGRVVHLHWTASNNATPVFYRVYRAVATGYRTPSGESTSTQFHTSTTTSTVKAGQGRGDSQTQAQVKKPASKPQLNQGTYKASGAQLNQGTIKAGGAQLSQGTYKASGAQLQRGALLGSAQFLDEFLPGPDDYTLLGATNNGECTLIDLVTRSQTTTYYFQVEPVNRWGQAGPKSAPFKVVLDPSLNPSVPIVDSVNANVDGSLGLTIETNLSQEKVTQYEIYRLEVPLPAKPAPKGNGTKAVGANYTKKASATAEVKASGPHLNDVVKTKSSQAEMFATVGAPMALDKSMILSNYTLVTTLSAPTDGTGSLTYSDTGVEPGKAYIYRVIAVNVVALKSDPTLPYDGIPVKVSADAPTVTLGTTPFDETTSAVSFTVNKPSSGAVSYLLERSADGINWKDLGERPCLGATTLVEDKPVRGNQIYKYRVYAVDLAGNVSVACEVTVDTH